jgi:hypothetical protein
MRFTSVKDVNQHSVLMLRRARGLLVPAVHNAGQCVARSYGEFDIIAPHGVRHVEIRSLARVFSIVRDFVPCGTHSNREIPARPPRPRPRWEGDNYRESSRTFRKFFIIF